MYTCLHLENNNCGSNNPRGIFVHKVSVIPGIRDARSIEGSVERGVVHDLSETLYLQSWYMGSFFCNSLRIS